MQYSLDINREPQPIQYDLLILMDEAAEDEVAEDEAVKLSEKDLDQHVSARLPQM